MSRLTEKELNRAALRYSAVLTTATIAVIGLNVLAGAKFGYDVRNLEWWLVRPALTIFICYVAVRLASK